MSSNPVKRRAGTTLVRQGDRPENVFLLMEGWAVRYKDVHGGKRQITAFVLPGDLCAPYTFMVDKLDHSIGLLSYAKLVELPNLNITQVTDRYPGIARAFWRSAMVDEAISREWLINIGQRTALRRMAHLLSELWTRFDQVGITEAGRFSLPVTQEQLGNALGISAVHANRVIQELRADGLIATEPKQLTVLNIDGLRRLSLFDPAYLHLVRRK